MSAVQITPVAIQDIEIKELKGTLCVLVEKDLKLGPIASRVDSITNGLIEHVLGASQPEALQRGLVLPCPVGMSAKAIVLAVLDTSEQGARTTGGSTAAIIADHSVTYIMDQSPDVCVDVCLGAALRSYSFDRYRADSDSSRGPVQLQFVVDGAAEISTTYLARAEALISGVSFARDLVNEPANVLNPVAYAERLQALEQYGLNVEILDEAAIKKQKMNCLWAVASGAPAGARVVVLKWLNAPENEPPYVMVGKGVTFDSGGLCIKPMQGMSEMKMDMSGSASVVGAMLAIAKGSIPINAVGVIGLVENMPSGDAMRPGDVVTSMKGDTVEIIDTDAEGRLVLADLLWFAQQSFDPKGIIDIATLTNAVMVALGRHRAGCFSNNDEFSAQVEKACNSVGELVWRMPLDPEYDSLLKSEIADTSHVGGRQGAAIIAARFLNRFVRPETPWVHLDISGVNYQTYPSALSPVGPTGWGVLAFEQLMRDQLATD